MGFEKVAWVDDVDFKNIKLACDPSCLIDGFDKR